MKKVYLMMLVNALFIDLGAQNFEWAKREGLWAYDYGYGITTDNAGMVYVAGKYEMNANFSNTILPCQGNHDIYVAQYSPSGALNWITTAGGPLGDYATCISCDGSNLYVAGEIEGWGTTIIFQNSPVTLTCQGHNDIFLAKYDLAGNLLWAKRAGGVYNEKALGVAHDNSGNIYICGFFNDTATFGGNTTIYGNGLNDIYIAKYDANGNFLWVRNAGSPGRDEAKGIKCDAAGNIYICGMYSSGCVFGSQVLQSPNGYFNTFLARYAPNGILQWVKTGGGDVDDVAWALTIDNAGKIYITGEYNAYAVFGSVPLISTGNADVFVACYDASGTVLWAKSAGGPLIDRARGIGCDGTSLYITGQYGNTAYFDSHSATAADSSDIFIAALNNSGNFLWLTAVGGPPDAPESLGYECGNTICAEASGNVYVTGSLLTGGVFGNTTYQAYDRTDVFITKISQMSVGGIVSQGSPSDILIYPNPSNGHFMLALDKLPALKIDMSVYDCLGQVILRETNTNSLTMDIDLSRHGSGIYFVEIRSPQKVYTEKIMIR